MKTEMISLDEVRTKGFEALVAALGVVDAIRFLQQYELGNGDYTEERKRLYDGKSAREIYAMLKEKQSNTLAA